MLIIIAIIFYRILPIFAKYCTPCCGRVTTKFFRLEIIAVWPNGQIAD